jgi:hypothetical protein
VNLGRWVAIRDRLSDDYPDDDTRQLLERAKEYVDNHLYRADVVPQIPSSAPPGYLMVTAGDPNLYVGTGTGVRKIPTQAV